MFRLLLCLGFALVVGFGGCAGSRTVGTASPVSLAEVNRVLAGREAHS